MPISEVETILAMFNDAGQCAFCLRLFYLSPHHWVPTHYNQGRRCAGSKKSPRYLERAFETP